VVAEMNTPIAMVAAPTMTELRNQRGKLVSDSTYA
jgi:hypothetical protein